MDRASMNAGTDLDCGLTYAQNLQAAVDQKLTTEGAIRQAVTRMYGALVRLGYFDPPAAQPLRQLGWSAVNTARAQAVAYRAVQESLVLLKNDGTLPLAPGKYKSVAIVGPWANNTGLGGIYSGPGPKTVTLAQGAAAAFASAHFAPGTAMNTTNTTGFAAALAAARAADVVVYAGGIDASLEMETRDRYDIGYPGNQLALVTQLAGLGKPLVVVQLGGGSVDNAPLKGLKGVNAILWAGYPGPIGGTVVFDALTGKVAPAGRLPYTQYPADYVNQVPMTDMSLRPSATSPGRTYKWYTGNATYPFGAGLHYTTFRTALSGGGAAVSIQDLVNCAGTSPLDRKTLATITAHVTNTGKVASDYVAALYASSTNGPAPHPKRELVAYQRVRSVAPGKTATATLVVTVGALSRIESNGHMSLFPGTYTLTLDNAGEPGHAQTTIKLTGSKATIETWS
jgi:beta-D-xylosidase 4